MNGTKLVVTPIKQGLLARETNELAVLVAVEAPDAPADAEQKRPPLNLALVVDRSGSMAGQPLREAKRCAEHVVGRLTPTDRVAIVEYDDAPGVVVANQLVRDPQAIRDRIDGIREGGCTNLHGGWLTGAEQVSPFVRDGTVSRVMLLSDGLANRGLLDRAEIYRQCEQLANAGVTTSTYGLGQQFDEELMTGMARAGRGTAYYGATAQDLFDPIEEELQLLAALCGRKVRVRYRGLNGVEVGVLNAFRRPTPDTVELPDLAYDAEAWVLLRLTIPQRVTEGDRVELLEVSAELELTDGTGVSLPAVRLELPVLPLEDFGALGEDARIRSRLAELDVARVEREAREAARRGDWDRVDQLMEVACEAGTDSAWAMRTIRELREIARRRDVQRMSKESHYAAFRKEVRLSPKQGAGPIDPARARYLRQKSLQGRADDEQ